MKLYAVTLDQTDALATLTVHVNARNKAEAEGLAAKEVQRDYPHRTYRIRATILKGNRNG
jgi:hypothetical protein